MPQVRILTDSSAYLPQVYADQYNIHVLPLTLTLEDREYRDGVADLQRTLWNARISPAGVGGIPWSADRDPRNKAGLYGAELSSAGGCARRGARRQPGGMQGGCAGCLRKDWGIFHRELLYESGGVVQTWRMELMRFDCVFRFEMEHLLRRAGFAAEVVFGDFYRNELKDDSEGMIWVARNPEG